MEGELPSHRRQDDRPPNPTNPIQPALRASLKALHLHPTRAQGLCNVALILEEWAIATFKRVQAR